MIWEGFTMALTSLKDNKVRSLLTMLGIIIGVAEEVWHYRYVGVEAATEMYEKGLCLEEYLAERQAVRH